jgi:signal transduction histidine kinase
MRHHPLILVIEDENNLRSVLIESLTDTFEVIAAADGLTGIEMARKHLPDVIVCDIAMPGLDGYGVLNTLSSDETTATIPFIFLTARHEYDDIRQGMNLGADDYLTKPFTLDSLRQAILTRLAKHTVIEQKTEKRMQQLRESITHALPHELRTPLTMIYGYVHLLLDEQEVLQPEQRKMLETVEAYAEHLHTLIEKFLSYSRTELLLTDANATAEQSTPAPDEIIKQVATELAANANRESDMVLGVNSATVGLPPEHLTNIMTELIDNAFKFSAAGAPVYVLGMAEDNVYAISVTDQGRGLTEDQIANIGAYMQFERPFYEQPGVGLGLVTAKRLAEAHGGQLTIESVPHQETTISVLLPCASTETESDLHPLADRA